MIYIFHGTDIKTTYLKVKQLAETFKNHQKIKVNKENLETLYDNIQTEDMFDRKKLIICQNLFSKKLIDPKKIKPTQGTILIFWDEEEIPTSRLKTFKDAKVENSKLPSTLFYFLDSIVPGSKKPFELLKKTDNQNNKIIWHLANRTLLLILVKLNFTMADAAKITNSNIAPWQWDKLRNQANMFRDVEDLKKLFLSTLKIDLMQKTGKTDIPDTTIVTFMLTRYLTAH